jgi:hypothetical protein
MELRTTGSDTATIARLLSHLFSAFGKGTISEGVIVADSYDVQQKLVQKFHFLL